jgi:GT2 family glycosyltransferase
VIAHEVPTLPVYLIHWDAPDWITSAVASVRASKNVSPIVSIVNNGGSLPAELDVDVVEMGSNAGYAAAANYALRLFSRTTEAHCVVGAHDLHVQPNTFRKLLIAAAEHPEFGVLGPHLREHGSPIARWDDVTERDWVSGTCLLIRRSCLEEVGGFDERFGSYVEDVDFCERARSSGWRVGTVDGALAKGLGSRDPHRAEMFTHANHALLDAKNHRWALVGRRLGGLARLCVTDRARSRFWASTLLLAFQRLALLRRSASFTAPVNTVGKCSGRPAFHARLTSREAPRSRS